MWLTLGVLPANAKALNVFDQIAGRTWELFPAEIKEKETVELLDLIRALEEKRLNERDWFFVNLHNLFIETHPKIFPNLAASFAQEFLEKHPDKMADFVLRKFFSKYTIDGIQGEVQEILNTLAERLKLRRETLQKAKADSLQEVKAIDENCKQLLDTLKQYGINAKTYEEALRIYEKRYPAQKGTDVVEKALADVDRDLSIETRLDDELAKRLLTVKTEEDKQRLRWLFDDVKKKLRVSGDERR